MKIKNSKIKIAAALFVVITAAVFVYNHFDRCAYLNWVPGSEQMYQLRMKTLAFSKNLLMHQRSFTQQEVSAALNFRIYEIGEDTVRAGIQLSDVSVTGSGRENKELAKVFSTFFLVEMLKTGEPVSFIFDNAISKEDERLIENLIRGIQLIIPVDASGSWQTEENDGTGLAVIEYSDKGDHIRKQKERYISVNSFDDDQSKDVDIKVLQSEISIVPSVSKSWIEKASGREKVEVSEDTGSLSTKLHHEFSLEMISFSPDKTLAIWQQDGAFDSMQASLAVGKKETESYFDRFKKALLQKKMGAENLDSIMKKFLARNGENHDLIILLRDYLILNPDDVYRILDILKTVRNDNISGALIHAICLSGTIHSQKALVELAEEKSRSQFNREQAVIALGQSKNPADFSVDSLYDLSMDRKNELSGEIANTAFYSLGIISSTLNNFDKDRAGAINRRLTALLENNSGDVELASTILKAMGNTGDSSLVDVIAPYLSSGSSVLRGNAAYSLRNMKDFESLTMLTDMASKEQDRDVRQAVVKAISKREPSEKSIAAAENIALKEDDYEARSTMINYLIKNKSKYPDVEDTLKTCLKKEITSNERIMIYRGLYSRNQNVN